MKFIAFNLVVGAALVYLFSADSGELHDLADRTHATVGQVKSYARDLVGKETPPAPPPVAAIAPEPAPEPKAIAKPVPKPEPKVAKAAPPPPPPKPKPAPKLAEMPKLPAATEVAQRPTPKKAALDVTKMAEKRLDSEVPPAVAKRRAEVLAGVGGASKPAPRRQAPVALAEGESLMSPAERRRKLHTLAEEMELMYARSAAQ